MTEFYYNRRKYDCCIYKTDSLQELRIRNEQGEVLAIEQGKKIGLQGKTRENSKYVDVSQPYFYNLIKAALSALEIAEKNQLIVEKDKVIENQTEQINILNQQLDIVSQPQISSEQTEKFNQLQNTLKDSAATVEVQKTRIFQLEEQLNHLPQILPLEIIEKQVISKLGESVWQCLHPASQRDLCNAYRCYQMIKSDDFANQAINYSTAGHPLGLVAEREIVAPFFSKLYNFLSNKNNQVIPASSFEVGGVNLKLKGRYTLGHLPPLLSTEYESFIENVLEQKDNSFPRNCYRTVFCSDKVSQTDRQLVKQFLQQWKHPLSGWLSQGHKAASKIAQIRLLRNRASHAETVHVETVLYIWQFKLLWLLLVGSKTELGVLQEIYSSTNPARNNSDRLRKGTVSYSPPSYLNNSIRL